MDIENIVSKFKQSEYAKQILQKLVQIDGDLKMNRNHAENYKMLRSCE